MRLDRGCPKYALALLLLLGEARALEKAQSVAEAFDARVLAPKGIRVRLVGRDKLDAAAASDLSEAEFVKIGNELTTQAVLAAEQARNDTYVVVRFYKDGKPAKGADYGVTSVTQTVNGTESTHPVSDEPEALLLDARGTPPVDLEAKSGILLAFSPVKDRQAVATYYVRNDPPIVYRARVVEPRKLEQAVLGDEARFVAWSRQFDPSHIEGRAQLELRTDDYVVLRAFRGGDPVTNKAARVRELLIATAAHGDKPLALRADPAATYVEFESKTDSNVNKAQHGTRARIWARDDAGAELARPWYVARHHTPDAYGVAILPWLGLWLPVGLVGTNFDSTSDGLVFTAAPISAALGARFWIGTDNYIGVSGAGSYTVSNLKTDEAGDTSEFTLRTVGGTVLVDLSGWINVGAMYVHSFADMKSPGWMLVAGAGPRVVGLGRR